MTTTDQLIQQTLARISTGRRTPRNKLSAGINDSVTSVPMTYDITGVANGARISIDLEDLGVWDADSAAKTATVQRGDFGSTAASHSSGAVVYVNPEYSPYEILKAINDELQALPGLGVYRYQSVNLTAGSDRGYNLTGLTNLIGVHRVSYESSADENWPVLNRRGWYVQQSLPTDAFASGAALFINAPVEHGARVRVLYRGSFSTLSTLAQDVETISGLPARAHTILEVGAAIRLAAGRALPRASMMAQGDTRRPEEVSATDAANSTVGLQRLHRELVGREIEMQTQEYGAGSL